MLCQFSIRYDLFSCRNLLYDFATRALNVSCVHKGTGKPNQVGLDERCVTILFDDVTQFTGLSRLLPLYYLWLQTPPRSSCFCYYQHDWVTQQLLHFPIRKLGSTHRSIATHPRHPSRPSVRPKISVSAVTRRLFKNKTFHQQPSVTTPSLLLPTTIHWQPVQAVQPSPN